MHQAGDCVAKARKGEQGLAKGRMGKKAASIDKKYFRDYKVCCLIL